MFRHDRLLMEPSSLYLSSAKFNALLFAIKTILTFRSPCHSIPDLAIDNPVLVHFATSLVERGQYGMIASKLFALYSDTTGPVLMKLPASDSSWRVYIPRLIERLKWFQNAEVSKPEHSI
jgi:hypothetical protein